MKPALCALGLGAAAAVPTTKKANMNGALSPLPPLPLLRLPAEVPECL